MDATCRRFRQVEVIGFMAVPLLERQRLPKQMPSIAAQLRKPGYVYSNVSIVKENCSTEYGESTPQDDLMERLLRARKG